MVQSAQSAISVVASLPSPCTPSSTLWFHAAAALRRIRFRKRRATEETFTGAKQSRARAPDRKTRANRTAWAARATARSPHLAAHLRLVREAVPDRARHAHDLLFERAAHAAQMRVVVASGQVVRERDLRQDRATKTVSKPVAHLVLRLGAGHDPSDAVAGCQGL